MCRLNGSLGATSIRWTILFWDTILMISLNSFLPLCCANIETHFIVRLWFAITFKREILFALWWKSFVMHFSGVTMRQTISIHFVHFMGSFMLFHAICSKYLLIFFFQMITSRLYSTREMNETILQYNKEMQHQLQCKPGVDIFWAIEGVWQKTWHRSSKHMTNNLSPRNWWTFLSVEGTIGRKVEKLALPNNLGVSTEELHTLPSIHFK